MQCIPAIDLRGGRVVRLEQGDFARASRYADDPLVLADAYAAAGARRLHVVDLDAAAREGSNLETVKRLCGRGLAVQAGGGVRDAQSFEAYFSAGAAAVVVGSLAVREPALVQQWLGKYGAERLVLACDVRIDATGAPQVLTDAWQASGGVDLWALLERYRGAGLRKVLCTDVSRDGLLQGPNLALYRECLRRFPELEWQASGGVGGPADLGALAAAGLPAAVVGRALLEGRVERRALAAYAAS